MAANAMLMANLIPAAADLIGGIISSQGDDDAGRSQLEEILAMQRGIPLPELRPAPYGQLPFMGGITPETYEAQIEGGPPTLAPADPRLREAQLRSLFGMERVAREGLPLEQRLLAEEAQRQLAAETTRGQEAVLSNLARRGRAGGGTELMARLAAAGGAAEQARGMGTDIARLGIEQMLQAQRDVPQLAGQMSDEDLRRSALLSEMQQRYNQFVSGLKTQAAANVAQQRAAAQLYNVGEQQRLAEENVAQQTRAAQEANRIQDALFRARQQRVGGITSALEPLGRYEAAEDLARRQRSQDLYRNIGQLGGGIARSFATPEEPRRSTPLTYGEAAAQRRKIEPEFTGPIAPWRYGDQYA